MFVPSLPPQSQVGWPDCPDQYQFFPISLFESPAVSEFAVPVSPAPLPENDPALTAPPNEVSSSGRLSPLMLTAAVGIICPESRSNWLVTLRLPLTCMLAKFGEDVVLT